jgi:uncharacterized OB-fold protein
MSPYRICPNGCTRNWYIHHPMNYCDKCGAKLIEEEELKKKGTDITSSSGDLTGTP